MVFVAKILRSAGERKTPRNYTKGLFIDSLRLLVRGGHGGNGYPKYGGMGGQGGDVVIISTEDETLSGVVKKWPTKRIIAGNGSNSHVNYILGPPGETVRLEVPTGITVYREDGRALAELNEAGVEALVARGGSGGSRKTGFIGLRGQSHVITLDLKLIADVGLVGFPNAGKSTLLKAVSRANPKIASYPFTTIRPNIGTMEYGDLRQISVADLPGLIEGAHANVGMGHRFLKHVERTRLLLLVVDISGFRLSPRHQPRTCLDTLVLLNKELELYRADLLEKPALLVLNKMDTAGAQDKYQNVRHQVANLQEAFELYPNELKPSRALVFDDVIPLSAKSGGRSISLLKDRIREVLDVRADMDNQQQLDRNTQLCKNTQSSLKENGAKLV